MVINLAREVPSHHVNSPACLKSEMFPTPQSTGRYAVKLALYQAILLTFSVVDQSKNVGLLRALHDVHTVEEYAPTFTAAHFGTDNLCVRRSVFRCTHGR